MADLLLLVMIAVAMLTDIWKRKIYNFLVVPAIILGLGLQFYEFSWSGILNGSLGFLLGIVLLLFPFFAGGIGAGDVKLLAAIGAIKGVSFTFFTFLYTALAGGIIAVIILFYKGKLLGFLKDVGKGSWLLLVSKGKTRSFQFKEYKGVYFPYGIAIGIGALIALWLR